MAMYKIFWLTMSWFVLLSLGLTEERCNCQDSGGWGAKGYILAVGAAAGAVVATPVVLTAVGFTSGGVAAGSVAAYAMGNSVAAGSLFATLQSAGAAGISYATSAIIAATTGGGVYYASAKGDCPCH